MKKKTMKCEVIHNARQKDGIGGFTDEATPWLNAGHPAVAAILGNHEAMTLAALALVSHNGEACETLLPRAECTAGVDTLTSLIAAGVKVTVVRKERGDCP